MATTKIQDRSLSPQPYFPLMGQQFSRSEAIAKISLKVLSTMLSAAGGILNVPMALKSGGKRAISYALATGTYLSSFSFATWSFCKIIDAEIKNRKNEKNPIFTKKKITAKRRALEAGTKLTILAVAALTQVPDAYNAYIYNGKNVLYPILSVVSTICFPFYSLYLSAEDVKHRASRSSFEKKLDKVKSRIMEKIEQNKLNFFKKSNNIQRTFFARKIRKASSREEIIEIITNWFDANFDEQTASQSLPQKCRNWIYKGFGYLNGISTTLSLSLLNFYIGSEASKLLSNNPFFYYSSGGIIVLCNLYLLSDVLIKKSLDVFHKIFYYPASLVIGNSITTNLFPKTRAICGLGAITVCSFSLGPTITAVNDYFKGSSFNKIMCPILKVTASDAIFLLGLNAMHSLVDDILKEIARFSNSKSTLEKELLEIDRGLENLSDFINMVSFDYFADLLLQFHDKDSFSELTQDLITKEDLRNYLPLEEKMLLPLTSSFEEENLNIPSSATLN